MSEGHCFKAQPLGTSIHGYEARQPPPPGRGGSQGRLLPGDVKPLPRGKLGKIVLSHSDPKIILLDIFS